MYENRWDWMNCKYKNHHYSVTLQNKIFVWPWLITRFLSLYLESRATPGISASNIYFSVLHDTVTMASTCMFHLPSVVYFLSYFSVHMKLSSHLFLCIFLYFVPALPLLLLPFCVNFSTLIFLCSSVYSNLFAITSLCFSFLLFCFFQSFHTFYHYNLWFFFTSPQIIISTVIIWKNT
jgi:hypothetical protein